MPSAHGKAVCFAPASVGNLGVGFDILGQVLTVAGDRVTVTATDEPVVRVGAVSGLVTDLPADPARNTATAGLVALIDDLGLDFGFEVSLEKGIPMGSGMGGSAASAVGAVVAANALLPAPLSNDELLTYCLRGEAVASGATHADNVAPCLYGGITLCDLASPPNITAIPVPPTLRCVLVHPHLEIATREGRAMLRDSYALGEFVRQSASLAGVIAGCSLGDVALIRRSLNDSLIEPQRAGLVPGFDDAKAGALAAGALGCSLSGSGPSLFAWVEETDAEAVRHAMMQAFERQGLAVDGWVSRIDGPGATLEAVVS